MMFIRRAKYERLVEDNKELRRQYGARVALERRNLHDLEVRYNALYDEFQARVSTDPRLEESHGMMKRARNPGTNSEGV